MLLRVGDNELENTVTTRGSTTSPPPNYCLFSSSVSVISDEVGGVGLVTVLDHKD